MACHRRDSIVSLKVEDVMVKHVKTIDANLTVKEAAQLMNKHEIGCLIVGKKGNPLGIITERDLLKRVVAQAKDATKTRVKDIMSTPLTTIKPETEIEDATKLMLQTKIKRLPVVHNQKDLVGLVTLTDMARFQPYLMKILKQLNARTTLLTNTEKNIIKKYLKTNKKLDGFEVTLHRCQNMQTLQEDLELINQFLAKATETKET
jgi:CBS-domain-containing membrane protein